MSKFNVGDKVIVKYDLHVDERYGNDKFLSSVLKHRGKEAIITNKWQTSIRNYRYSLNIDGGVFCWSADMLEHVDKKENKDSLEESRMEKGFSVGDKVVVREDLEIGKRYDLCRFVNSMARYKGKEVVITHIWIESGGKIRYNINDDNGVFIWSGKMFRVDKKENNETEAFLDLCSKEVIETMYAALKNTCDEKQIERDEIAVEIDSLIAEGNKIEKEIKELEEAKKILSKRLEELNGGK